MLDTSNCQEHFDEVVRTAKGTGQWPRLESALKILEEYQHPAHQGPILCRLYKYAAPMSFTVYFYYGDQQVGLAGLLWEKDNSGQYAWNFKFPDV